MKAIVKIRFEDTAETKDHTMVPVAAEKTYELQGPGRTQTFEIFRGLITDSVIDQAKEVLDALTEEAKHQVKLYDDAKDKEVADAQAKKDKEAAEAQAKQAAASEVKKVEKSK